MKVHCKYDELVATTSLNPHPKNRNQHPASQVTRLAKILDYQGWRYPIKVSKLSGYVTSGHGRILAAKEMGWDKVPVNYQDYESEEQEYADVQADNAIASWAELDLSLINEDLPDLGPDFDIEMLGLENFELEPADKAPRKREDLRIICPLCEGSFPKADGQVYTEIDDTKAKEALSLTSHNDESSP